MLALRHGCNAKSSKDAYDDYLLYHENISQ